ncbi:MAG: pyridoxamine 5'-phosphate oxidase [Marinilabiliaceae bacterium]
MKTSLSHIRNNYKKAVLLKDHLDRSPLVQLQRWLDEAIHAEAAEPTAMSLATVDAAGQPSQRIVLLKEISDKGIVFFTNYQSRKGQQLELNPRGSANFFWAVLERQVRLEGIIKKISEEESDEYFATRPRDSQIGAWTSPQSEEINDRDYLERRYQKLEQEFEGKTIPRPPHWGGYILIPHLVEFWQGRPGRMHDRFVYRPADEDPVSWKIHQLAP